MNIFIHYLDKELLDIYCTQRYSEDIIKKVVVSIKIALLLLETDDCVYIPASNYFESRLAQKVLDHFRDIIDMEYIRLVSSSTTLHNFLNKKKTVYSSLYNEEMFAAKEENILYNSVPGIWTPRNNSATKDIISSWRRNIDSSFWQTLYEQSGYRKIGSFERDLDMIPKKLGNQAFVADHVLPNLKIPTCKKTIAKETINEVISKYYIESFLKEYNAVCFKNIFLLSEAANRLLPEGYNHIDYRRMCRDMMFTQFGNISLYEYIDNCDNYKLMHLKKQIKLEDKKKQQPDKKMFFLNGKEKKGMQTFIVHGHDGEARLELKNYLQNTLNLGEPIILAERASGGKTIMEKFEKYAAESNLVFVLLTPDDKYTDSLNNVVSRARQNVIFEMGYFLGKLGRESGRVILLYKGNLELPNDISGVIYINIDNGIKAAGEDIRKEIDFIINNK